MNRDLKKVLIAAAGTFIGLMMFWGVYAGIVTIFL
jgi:hypothetical protein